MDKNRNENELSANQVELNVEELEVMVAPGLTTNHSETVEVELALEELEEVIAPGIKVPD